MAAHGPPTCCRARATYQSKEIIAICNRFARLQRREDSAAFFAAAVAVAAAAAVADDSGPRKDSTAALVQTSNSTAT